MNPHDTLSFYAAMFLLQLKRLLNAECCLNLFAAADHLDKHSQRDLKAQADSDFGLSSSTSLIYATSAACNRKDGCMNSEI